MTRDDMRMFEQGRMQGIGDGFTVPVHVPGEARGTCTFATDPGRPLVGTFAFETARRLWLIPTCNDHNPLAHLRRPMVMMCHG
jgi:LuxR family quorum-sensing system transcriptional regulator CciR